MTKLYRKDFFKLAYILNKCIKYSDDKTSFINLLLNELCQYLQLTNNKFDKNRFIDVVLK
jgi:hypothetical protein